MSRRRARQFALQAMYQSDLTSAAVAAALNSLWSGLMDDEGIDDQRAPESAEVEFAQRLSFGATEHVATIDTLIESCSTNWRIARMSLVDRNILRLAGFELMKCEDIPATVTINEAVELAKLFGTAESRSFVNGIVDQMARRLERLPGASR